MSAAETARERRREAEGGKERVRPGGESGVVINVEWKEFECRERATLPSTQPVCARGPEPTRASETTTNGLDEQQPEADANVKRCTGMVSAATGGCWRVAEIAATMHESRWCRCPRPY
jgi:hypothetical protein